MRWHQQVVGMLEPEECARHFLARSKTIDPTGRFEVSDVMHEALPRYGDALMEACAGGDEADVERAFVRFATAYNAFAEGVLTMPSYEIVIDTCDAWGAFPALKQGFRMILADEGRHITFGTDGVPDPDREGPVLRGGRARGVRRVPRQRRRPRRVPEGRARASTSASTSR